MALKDSLEQLQNFDLADLDLNNIGSWPGAVKVIVMVLLFLLVMGGGYYVHITDKQKALETAERKEQELRKDFETKSEKAANLDAYRQQKAEMETTFQGLLRQLPSDTEVPGLIEDITRTALDNELNIESIDLQDEVRTEFYVELPIRIVVEGNYHKIGSFVSGVANLSRIVTLHDFVIEPQDSPVNLKMSILAKTYRYLDEDE
ncbi:MAG TPA: type 4a pilus biogenesis protein PilO [Pseudomonadales bacterium]